MQCVLQGEAKEGYYVAELCQAGGQRDDYRPAGKGGKRMEAVCYIPIK